MNDILSTEAVAAMRETGIQWSLCDSHEALRAEVARLTAALAQAHATIERMAVDAEAHHVVLAQAIAERDLVRQRYQERFGAGDDLAQVGQPTDEPDANGTAWAQVGYWKVRCDELSDSLEQTTRLIASCAAWLRDMEQHTTDSELCRDAIHRLAPASVHEPTSSVSPSGIVWDSLAIGDGERLANALAAEQLRRIAAESELAQARARLDLRAEVAQLTAALAQVRTWAETTKDVTGCEPCRQAAWDVLDLLPPAASVPKEQP